MKEDINLASGTEMLVPVLRGWYSWFLYLAIWALIFAIGAYKKLWNPTPCHLTQWLRFLCLYLDVLDVVFRNHNLILSVCRTFRFSWLAPFTTLYSLLSRCLSRWCSIFHNTLHGRCQMCLVGHLDTCVHDLYSIVKFRWNPETELFCRRNYILCTECDGITFFTAEF